MLAQTILLVFPLFICSDATVKVWEVPFPSDLRGIFGQYFLERFAPTYGGATLRQSVNRFYPSVLDKFLATCLEAYQGNFNRLIDGAKGLIDHCSGEPVCTPSPLENFLLLEEGLECV